MNKIKNDQFAACGQGWGDLPCKHELTIQDCIQCVCIHGHARDCGDMGLTVMIEDY